MIGTYAALDHVFTVEVAEPALGTELRRILADLATSGVEATACYVVTPEGGGHTLSRDGTVVDRGSVAHVLAMLLWDVNRAAVASVVDDVVLHAGAVVHDDAWAVVLPGAQEAGKTTLVTALVRDGWGYLSDELSALRAGAPPTVRPYPKVLSVDPGSWSLFPDLGSTPRSTSLSPNQWLLRAGDLHPAAVHRADAPLAAVVFPTRAPGGATRATRLDPLEALRRLAECTFGFHDRPDVLLPRLAPVAASVPAWDLVVGDGHRRAVDLIASVVAEAAADREQGGGV